MIINRLKVTQLRAFDEAEFAFNSAMNLLVGVNGVGKSTVLDALRILLSQVIKELSAPRLKTLTFTQDDITIGRDFLTAEISFDTGGVSYLVHNQREEYVPNKAREGEVRHQTLETPDREKWIFTDLNLNEKKFAQQLRRDKQQPLALFFSSHRSLTNVAAAKGKGEGIASAVKDALEPRELRLQEIADWWLAREALAKEDVKYARPLEALQDAVSVFLEGYGNLRAVSKPKPTLLIDKAGITLDVRQLSEGERGVLALVLELTTRLSKANQHLENPARDGTAIVLIDELDLHLHPRWQRTIVSRLIETFPKCQFIATTHSPQIVGEVSPEQIYILQADGEKPFKPDQSLGMDTNWILRRLMETDERDPKTNEELKAIADLVEKEEYVEAQQKIDALRDELGDFTELIRLQTRIDRFSILKEE